MFMQAFSVYLYLVVKMLTSWRKIIGVDDTVVFNSALHRQSSMHLTQFSTEENEFDYLYSSWSLQYFQKPISCFRGREGGHGEFILFTHCDLTDLFWFVTLLTNAYSFSPTIFPVRFANGSSVVVLLSHTLR